MDECQTCKDLNVKVDIRSPSELKKVLEVVKEAVATGTLTVLQKGIPWSTSFDQVKISGPWDDIVCYVFQCNSCGRKFEISVETYHGRGGGWKPL